jgi:hypothetical protein
MVHNYGCDNGILRWTNAAVANNKHGDFVTGGGFFHFCFDGAGVGINVNLCHLNRPLFISFSDIS